MVTEAKRESMMVRAGLPHKIHSLAVTHGLSFDQFIEEAINEFAAKKNRTKRDSVTDAIVDIHWLSQRLLNDLLALDQSGNPTLKYNGKVDEKLPAS